MSGWNPPRILNYTIDTATGFIQGNAATFNPANIANLGVWLDAQDPTSFTYSTGSDVAQWNDKSGNGNHAVQPTGSLQPLRVTNAINNLPAVQFRDDGTAKMLASPDAVSLDWVASLSAFAVIVWLTDLGSGFEHVHGKYAATGSQREWRSSIIDTVSNAHQMTASLDGTSLGLLSTNSTVALALNTPYILEGTANTGTAVITQTVNNADLVTLSPAAFITNRNDISPYNVGARNTAADPYAGYIGELIWYTTELTAGQRTQVLTYLSAKWGIIIA